MKTLEIEGKTIDEAIEKACREFNVPREKLNVEILSEGSSGIFGIGSKKAKIRAGLLSLDMDFEREFGDKPAEPEAQGRSNAEESVRTESHQEAETKQNSTLPDIPAEASNAGSAKELLEGILRRMTLDFPVTMEETQEAVIFKIAGDGSGILIGKGGQTLDAIQYILNKSVNTSSQDKRRIILDTEDYRERREDYLIALTAKLADKVKKTKKPVTLNYMSARDRRIIHMALKGDDRLMTKSRGEGSYRKIVILPKRQGGPKKPLTSEES